MSVAPPLRQIVQAQIEQLSQRPDLLPVIAGWVYNEWWRQVEGTSVDTVTDLLRANLVANRIPMTLVASVDHAPVGTATLLAHDAGTEEWPQLSPWLAAVYVTPECRRRGVGASLVNAIVAHAASLGVSVLYLWTVERVQFYADLGWNMIETRGIKRLMSRSTIAPP